MTRLAGAVVLITGGTSGIGHALANTLLAQGCHVVVCGRDQGRLDAARRRLAGVEALACDVTENGQIAGLLAHVERRWGRLDVLVNNAGRMTDLDFLQAPLSASRLAEEIQINLMAPINVTNLALPLLLRGESGTIVMVGSGYGWTPSARAPVYSAAKAGLRAFTKALRMQLDRAGVGVMEVIPPAVDTPSTAHRKGPKVSAELVAAKIASGISRNAREVFIGDARAIPLALRLAPRLLEDRVGRA
ncbi:MAG TPA: SDR family NAD(P)-dependent oxidoreductase [Caulobacteraceae bacterium]|nr:SDR family NAD(P)-dependent oxidoreductase [Caulobacteraceae bacterium]